MKYIRLIVIIVITLVVGTSALHLVLTGRPFPKRIVEQLNNPLQVSKITAAGFVTTEGEVIKVNYVSELPTNSTIVRAAVKGGVEIGDDGQIYGLLKIHHWCGNDPVRHHIARVNLSDLILATGGIPDPEVPKDLLDSLVPKDRELRYGKYGLSISDLYHIEHISSIIKAETEQ